MILCGKCGNKRCPHAENHKYKCTNSNALNQIGEEEHLPGGINKMVVDKLNQLIEMYEEGAITKYSLIVMIDELYEKRCVNG